MDNDLSRFRDVFFEEAAEHISGMEEALLRLESAPGDSESLHAVFRAVHSIKGSGGMFGLEEVVRFAHDFESLLDDLRNHLVPVTGPLTGLLLEASDILKGLVAAARAGTEPPPGVAPLIERLASVRSGSVPDPAAAAPPAEAAPAGRRVWNIRFRPASAIFDTGMDPHLVLRDLTSLGQTLAVRLDTGALPRLAALDPNVCYLGWELRLDSDAGEDRIRDAFAFVEDGAEIAVSAEAEPAPPDSRPSSVAAPETAPHHAPREISTVRVATAKVDKLVDLVGELVIAQSVAGQILSHFEAVRLQELREAFTALERNTRELQERVMAVRMQPVGGVFSRFPRVVRDLAAANGKQIALEVSGEETELDKSVIERLADPITHLVRNSADHGIETPEQRRVAGKPDQGVIRLQAYHEGGNVVVEVSDDGRGLDGARIRAKALERGLIAASDSLTDEETQSLIFRPGFSTAEKVTDLSGRGVGMDVVRRNVESLNGAIGVRSLPGRGASFRIRLPLTLAILDGLLLRIGSATFVLPLVSIVESIRPRRDDLRSLAGGGQVVSVRGEALPLLRLHLLFGVPDAITDPAAAAVVIVEHENRRLALLVDELLGQQQVVVKSLEAHFHKVDGAMGATILGDGRVALILDVAGIAGLAGYGTDRFQAA
jgi:two-component system, chemotaxis family, sensor kinase CheA